MEIKTSEEIYKEVKLTLNDKGWIDDEIIARVAMKRFAQQFIDLAADKSQEMMYDRNKESKEEGLVLRDFQVCYATPKQSILDIKQLIK